jgi:hypothetical protein
MMPPFEGDIGAAGGRLRANWSSPQKLATYEDLGALAAWTEPAGEGNQSVQP